ncbi:MAG: leucine-rich repeat domain-containing protein [Thainema sp.]
MKTLSLYDDEISDITPLARLSNLQQLSLFDNQIEDISPLASLN